MCGITGFWGNSGDGEELRRRVLAMSDRISHRGPDGFGYWVSARDGLGLGHRRLAVIDLSEAGQQPMVSSCGEWIISFNGEIYNHLELRAQLHKSGRQIAWRGHSDTEVLLEAVVLWGLTRALEKCRGMFALALWNVKERTLHLARDRLGEKPLYYGWQRGSFIFASDLSAFHGHPDFENQISDEAVGLYLRHCYVPGPYSIYTGIQKLPPGTTLTLGASGERITPKPYWQLADAVSEGAKSPLVDESVAVLALEAMLSDVVTSELEADVPVGVLLSGGIDSLAVTSFAQANSRKRVSTFSVGVDDPDYDESMFARQVAEQLGTRHTELRMRASDAMQAVEEMAKVYSEPFADASQVPTFMIMQKVSEHCTVALSGDGGDENFGGYQRYQAVPLVWDIIRRIPPPVRPWVGRLVQHTAASERIGLIHLLGRLFSQPQMQRKLEKLGQRIHRTRSIEQLFIDFQTEWTEALHPSGTVCKLDYFLANPERWVRTGDQVLDMMAVDTQAYLPDDILVKVDRASMAHSLELRVPFLDHRLVELAWRIPRALRFKDGRGKYILRRLLAKTLPGHLIDRPKMGFGIPIDKWLRGPLRRWGEDLLSYDSLRAGGLMDPSTVRETWNSHVRHGVNHGNRLWAVLMLQSWLRLDRRSARP